MNKKRFVLLIFTTSMLLAFTIPPSSTALNNYSSFGGGGFVTGGGWIESPPGAYHPINLPLFDGSYYQLGFAETPVTWDEARVLAGSSAIEACTSAHLATVTSAEEQAVISALMEPTTENGWLGGFQAEDELSTDQNWQWITGEPFDYLNWAFGEPNDNPFGTYIPGSEQDLETYQGSGLWNDAPGWEPKYYYIIEYENCTLPAGRAIFNFVARFKKGAAFPSGSAKFKLNAAGLDFQSTSLDSLAVSPDGTSAEISGTGTINGQGAYFFTVWAADDVPDTFRIKIWWEDTAGEHVVYDSGVQPVGGGNIVIHTVK